MKYLIKCCNRVVDVDNKPIWCIKCGEHSINVVEYNKDTMLSCPFCGGEPLAESLSGMYWYECEDCTASSGHADDWVKAKQNWNMRGRVF